MKITIETDDQDPNALKRAQKIITTLTADAVERERMARMLRDVPEARRAVLREPLESLGLHVRTINALPVDLKTIGDLTLMSAAKLRSYQGIGAGTVKEIRAALAALDLGLSADEAD